MGSRGVWSSAPPVTVRTRRVLAAAGLGVHLGGQGREQAGLPFGLAGERVDAVLGDEVEGRPRDRVPWADPEENPYVSDAHELTMEDLRGSRLETVRVGARAGRRVAYIGAAIVMGACQPKAPVTAG
jgi:hypothetical protein